MVVSSAAILTTQALGNMGFTVGVGVGVAAESSFSDTFRSRSNEPVVSSFFVVASIVYVPADRVADMRECSSTSALES